MRGEATTTIADIWGRPESIVDQLLRQPESMVTPLLEDRFGERLYAQRVQQQWQPADAPLSEILDITLGQRALIRRVVLRGRSTGVAYLEEHSRIVLERLPVPMACALLTTTTPIGTLLGASPCRTGRDLVDHDEEAAGPELALRFGVPAATSLSVRRYRVAGPRPLMWVCERFHPCAAQDGLTM